MHSAWRDMTQIARSNTMLHFDSYLKPMFCPSETSPDEDEDEFDIETYHCPVPGVAPDQMKGIIGGHLVLTADEMKGVFEETFVEIKKLVQHQITTAEIRNGTPITVNSINLSLA